MYVYTLKAIYIIKALKETYSLNGYMANTPAHFLATKKRTSPT